MMGTMTARTASSTPEQLTLLPEATVPLRFRLDEATRRRGLRHAAELRAALEAGSAAPPVVSSEERPGPTAPGSRALRPPRRRAA